jgi:uncharacterized lipoprotein YddW (UPF0748 family)
LAFGFSLLAPVSAQPEFRGAWVATVFNLDWPSKPGLSAAEQKAQLLAMLDRARELKMNAILLQVRSVSDACYESTREPWSEFLSGKQGIDPGYDPLAFAVKEAHARGIELHAWFNPFRAGTKSAGSYAANHVTHTHPEWIRPYGGQLWVDPGEPEARRYILDVILDVVKRYDIDGVHIDDYFYPYPVKGAGDFRDDASWRRYGANSGMTRDDWRRDNINRFVEAMYREVKAQKPALRVGISPFGIWRPRVPATIEAGLDAYGQLYADARHWLAEGWCDYLTPQLYWGIEPAKQSFPVLLHWWREQSSAGRPVWPGIATERIGRARPAQEIAQQIELTRQDVPAGTAPGNIQWSMKALMRDQGGIDALLKHGVYSERAVLPRP